LSFSVSGPAVLAGGFLIATAPGPVTIAAYQSGDTAWYNSAPVGKRFVVGENEIEFCDGKAALERTSVSGNRQSFRFVIPNRSVVLFSTSASVFDARLRDESGSVLFQQTFASGNQIEKFLEPGEYVLELAPQLVGVEILDYEITLDATVDVFTRPDIAVGGAIGRMTGTGIYLPKLQSFNVISRNARRVSAYFLISNQGTIPDTLGVKGGVTSRFFSAQFFGRTTNGSNSSNLTASIKTGTFRTAPLSRNHNPLLLTSAIKPEKRRPQRSRHPKTPVPIPISVSSQEDATLIDRATARILLR
jgi:hypothetical protein